jgi:hypothetical protein
VSGGNYDYGDGVAGAGELKQEGGGRAVLPEGAGGDA